MLQLTDFEPASHLRPYIQRYILTEGIIPAGEKLDHLLIPGLTEIVYFNLSDDAPVFKTNRITTALKYCSFAGQFSKAFHGSFQGKIRIIGAHMYTPAGYRLFQLPMDAIANEGVTLPDVFGSRMIDFCNQLREQFSTTQIVEKLDAFFTTQLRKTQGEAHAVLLNSLSMLDVSLTSGPVKAMAQYNKVSARTLQKVFLNQVGLTPKEYCRMYRFSEVIRMINTDQFAWKKAVERLGYYDQAHFLNDFKSVTGLTPSSYLSLHPHINKFITDFYD